jgi:putative FmdB family regulatory protein
MEVTMAQYVFLCQACREQFTQFLHMSELDTREVKCPKCGGSEVERQVAIFSAATSKKS